MDVVDDRIADYGQLIIDECHHLSARSTDDRLAERRGGGKDPGLARQQCIRSRRLLGPQPPLKCHREWLAAAALAANGCPNPQIPQ